MENRHLPSEPTELSREALIPEAIPDWNTVLGEGRAAGQAVERDRTAFHRYRGVDSQHEWRMRCRAEGRPRTIMNIGLADWPQTREALAWIWAQFEHEGLPPPDSYQLILERRMGLPAHLRADMPQETGPVLAGPDWKEAAQTVPIQPQAPLVCSPASFENVLEALAAGFDTLGNFSGFVLRYPYWDDDVAQISSVLRALGAMSAHRDSGVVVDSYLEDGHCGMFLDLRSIVGWALVERHLVEHLCGARYAVACGGLTADPFERAALFRAHEINASSDLLCNGYLHGGTVGHVESLTRNLGLFTHDTSVSLAANRHFNWGTAYLPVPLTERERVPTPEEILDVHRMARALEPHAVDLAQHIDWTNVERHAQSLAEAGRLWWSRLRECLQTGGFDTDNPLQLMLALRRISPQLIERIGLGEDAAQPEPTALARLIDTAQQEARASVAKAPRCDGLRAVVASSDIHFYAKPVLEAVLADRGVEVVDGGLAADPEQLVAMAVASQCSAVVVTTHNGWALNFGRRLARDRDRLAPQLLLVMGGVLNEDTGPGSNSSVPRDVSIDLRALGVVATNDFEKLAEALSVHIRDVQR